MQFPRWLQSRLPSAMAPRLMDLERAMPAVSTSIVTLILILASSAPSAAALSPLSSPSTPKKTKIGVYVAIGVASVFCSCIIFYMGMRYGRTGSWACWRSSPIDVEEGAPSSARTRSRRHRHNNSTSTQTTNQDFEKQDPDQQRRGRRARTRGRPADINTTLPYNPAEPHIDSAQSIPRGTSPYPAELTASPIRRSPRRSPLELPANDFEPPVPSVHEIGTYSRWSWLNIAGNRNSSGSRDRSRARTSRGSSTPNARMARQQRSQHSLYEMDTAHVDPDAPPVPRFPDLAVTRPSTESSRRDGSEKESSASMNFEGLEWLRKMYRERGAFYRISWRNSESKSDVHLPR